MKVPKKARREAKDLFRACLVNGLLDENRVRQLVDQVLTAKPRGFLAVLTHFQRLLKLDLDRRSARVESVVVLDAPFQAAIRSSLEQRYGPGLNFSFVQNPALLGGIRIQVGSDLFDGSVQARLHDLEQSFESA